MLQQSKYPPAVVGSPASLIVHCTKGLTLASCRLSPSNQLGHILGSKAVRTYRKTIALPVQDQHRGRLVKLWQVVVAEDAAQQPWLYLQACHERPGPVAHRLLDLLRNFCGFATIAVQ